jgi:hypothetical protein
VPNPRPSKDPLLMDAILGGWGYVARPIYRVSVPSPAAWLRVR